MRKELYFIRHGETEYNALGMVQGRGIDADLNDIGRKQAEAFYQYYKNLPFDKLYTSTLKRTHQTVKRFIDSGLAWEQLSGLDELAWGELEGKPATEDSRGYGRHYGSYRRTYRIDLHAWACPASIALQADQ
jgi:broad specificity phosphatase PhoE